MAASLPSNAYWVEPGRLLAGPHPSWPDADGTATRLEQLRCAGIDLFVDLTTAGERDPYAGLLQEGARHERRGIADRDTASRGVYRDILDLIDEAHGRDERVYVHCLAGIGRTGTVVGCWLRRHGLDGGDAVTRIAELRRGLPDAWQRSPETDAQRLVIAGWGHGD